MTISITYGLLRKPDFLRAFNVLSRHPKFDNFETKRRIFKMGKQLDDYLDEVVELHTKLVESFAKLDDEGKFVLRDGRPGTFTVPEEKAEEFKAELEKFDATKVELKDCQKVDGNRLGDCPLTPTDLLFLDDLIDMD